MIDKVKYDEYIESLLNISRLTNKENSILINFDISGETCSNVVSFIQRDGTKDILKDSTFVCDDEFYKDFLEKFIIEYYEEMVVAFNDNIDISLDGKYSFRVVTDDNDMLSINGLSLEYANYLMELTKKRQEKVEEYVLNDDGVTTAFATFIIVSGIGIAILAMVLLLS